MFPCFVIELFSLLNFGWEIFDSCCDLATGFLVRGLLLLSSFDNLENGTWVQTMVEVNREENECSN